MGVLKIRNSGNTDWIEVGGVGGISIQDADGDTKVQCEESADEDIIRIDCGGEQVAYLANAAPHLTITDPTEAAQIRILAGATNKTSSIKFSESGITDLFSLGAYGSTYVGGIDHQMFLYNWGEADYQQRWNKDGEVTLPLQPWVECGGITAAMDNLAINTAHTIKFDQLTEQGGDNWNNTTWQFTAPVSGKYYCHACLGTVAIDADASIYYMMISTSNRTIQALWGPDLLPDGGNYMPISVSAVVDMDANDTVHFTIYQAGGAAQTDIIDLSANTYCSIMLIG